MRISDWSSDVCSSDLSPCAVAVTVTRGSEASVAASSGTTTGEGRAGACGGAACSCGSCGGAAGGDVDAAAVAGDAVRAAPVVAQAGSSRTRANASRCRGKRLAGRSYSVARETWNYGKPFASAYDK